VLSQILKVGGTAAATAIIETRTQIPACPIDQQRASGIRAQQGRWVGPQLSRGPSATSARKDCSVASSFAEATNMDDKIDSATSMPSKIAKAVIAAKYP